MFWEVFGWRMNCFLKNSSTLFQATLLWFPPVGSKWLGASRTLECHCAAALVTAVPPQWICVPSHLMAQQHFKKDFVCRNNFFLEDILEVWTRSTLWVTIVEIQTLLKEAETECDQDNLPVMALCVTASPTWESRADVASLVVSCQAQSSPWLRSQDLAGQELLAEVWLNNPPVGWLFLTCPELIHGAEYGKMGELSHPS